MAGEKRIPLHNEMPNNSFAAKQAPVEKKGEEREGLQKVVSGKVTKKKEGFGTKFREAFLQGESAETIKDYILFDVMVPQIKNTIIDSIEMVLFGKVRTNGERKKTNGTVYNFNSIYSGNRTSSTTNSGRSPYASGDIILETKQDADDVLEAMLAYLEQFGYVSIAELNDLIGVTGEFTDEKYGWTNLRDARVMRAGRDGYLLKLPRVELLT